VNHDVPLIWGDLPALYAKLGINEYDFGKEMEFEEAPDDHPSLV
jgi:hypothetical protein